MTPRQKLIKTISTRLGAGMVDVELDPDHLDLAIDNAVARYRQRSNNAMEESFLFIEVQPEQQVYRLPDEVQEVRALYRRSVGGQAGGANIDPFSLGWSNYIYQIQNPAMMSSSGAGMLASYDFAMQYQELVGRMFGRDVMYTWDTATKRLTMLRRFNNVETIAVHIYNARPEDVLLIDVYAYPWIKDYATAQAMLMLGEARTKFSSLGGPQGGVSLNGDRLIGDAKETMQKLDEELEKFIESHDGMPFIIG